MLDIKLLKLTDIRIDGGTQARAKIDQTLVTKYADSMRDGDMFPHLTVFFDGAHYWLADGFHRYLAMKSLGHLDANASVFEGTQRDAKLHSFAANARHGMPMTKEEQRQIIRIMLEDEEWSRWSFREIACHIGVSHMTVARVKEAMDKEKETPEAPKQEAKVDPPKKEEPKEAPQQAPKAAVDESMIDDLTETVNALAEENTLLKDKIAVGQWDATEIEKIDIEDLIKELREKIRVLEIENAALRDSRDMFQNRNAELIRQVKSLQSRLKKVGA